MRTLIVLGYGLRLGVWLLSEGSNDIRTWHAFAQTIAGAGLAETYRTQPLFNHPPLMGWWSVLALSIADLRILTFAQVFKIPALIAEVFTGTLLFDAWTSRDQPRRAWQGLAGYALSASCILISAFHGNTDAVYFCLAFASAHLLETGRPFEAGTALAAAINVKLIPVLLVFPLASRCTRPSERLRFLAGLAPGAVPFLIAFLTFNTDQRAHFAGNLLRYQSNQENWGIELAVRLLYGLAERSSAALADGILRADDWYAVHGASALFVAVAAFAAWHVWRHRGRAYDSYQLAALVFGLFLLFGSGFGVQYVGCIVAPLLAWSIWDGLLVASATGVFIGAVYARFMLGWAPMASHHGPIPDSFIGLSIAAWTTIAVACVRLVRSRTVSGSNASPRPADSVSVLV